MTSRERSTYESPGLRLLGFYVLLRSGKRKYSLTRLSQLFHCSRQTILRMVEQLELVGGITISAWTEGRDRYYQVIQETGNDPVVLSAESLQQLMLCRDIVRFMLPQPIHEEIRNAIGAASILLPEKKNPAPILDSFASAKGRGSIDYTPFQGILETLQTGMRERRVCKLKYRPKMTDPVQSLVIMPVRLMAYRETLYIKCFPCDKKGEKTFDKPINLAVHRMVKADLTQLTFPPQDIAEDSEHFGLEFNPPLKVRVAFTASVASYIAERTWSNDQQIRRGKDGGIILTFTTTSRPEVISWILGFGAEASVLEPLDLAQDIKKTMTKAIQGYDQKSGGAKVTKKENSE